MTVFRVLVLYIHDGLYRAYIGYRTFFLSPPPDRMQTMSNIKWSPPQYELLSVFPAKMCFDFPNPPQT